MPRRLLPIVIVVLALADGVLHLMLDVVLFRGNFVGPLGPPGPPPGAPPGGGGPPAGPLVPLPLPLNQLFLLNFIGYVVLVILFWLAPRWFGGKRWWVDVALILYTAVSIVGWLDVGRPNPMGLGYLAKAIEVVLIVALVAHIWLTSPRTAARGATVTVAEPP